MTRETATALLSASACAAVAVSGAVPPALPAACLALLLAGARVLGPARRHLPDFPLTLLHTALLVGAFYLAALRAPQVDLLSVVLTFGAPFLALAGLGRPTVFNEFLKVLVALLLVVGSAAVAPGLLPVAITAGYLVVACQVLPVLAGRAAISSGARVRVLGGGPGRWRHAPSLVSHHLALFGLVVGAALYLLVPRPDLDGGATARHAGGGGLHAGSGGSSGRTIAGPATGFPGDVRIGDIGRIKRRPGIVLEAAVSRHGRAHDAGSDEQALLLLRARAWTSYDPARRRWARASDAGRALPANGRLEPGPAPFSWAIEMLGYDGRTLFLPQRAREIRSAAPALYLDRLSGVRADEPVGRYSVEAAEPVLRGEDFAMLRCDMRDESLLYVPRTLDRALRPYTPRRTGTSILHAVGSIRDYFARAGFRYTLDLPRSLPLEQDPVVAFLERKEGHCELFATAACLFLRQMGVPARLAGGLRCSERIGPGRYRARFSNAHAWVEIRCIGKGFVAVDFTPPDSSAAPPGPGDAGEAEAPEEAERRPDTDGFDWTDPFAYGGREQRVVRDWVGERILSGPVAWSLAALLALVAVRALLRARRGRPPDPLRVTAPTGASRRTLAFYVRWLRTCAERGHRRRLAQTPREFLASLPADLRPEGREVTTEFERRRYGAGG